MTEKYLSETNIDEDILNLIFERLNDAIKSSNKILIRVVQRVLLNMLASEDSSEIVDKIMSKKVLDVFHEVLELNIAVLQLEVLWGLSNVACHDLNTLN